MADGIEARRARKTRRAAGTRALILLSDCGLLSRRNARRYCGCLGEERFDREVGPHVTARLIGRERFYSRKELDAWIHGIGQPAGESLLESIRRAHAEHAAYERETTRIVLAAMRDAKRPCTTRELTPAPHGCSRPGH
jgi:hypothetical protein